MKQLLILFAFIATTAQAQHFQDDWKFRTDKKFHAFVGFQMSSVFASGCYHGTSNFKKAMVLGVSVGGGVNLLKEVFDLTTGLGTASVQDFAYGVGGAVIGSLSGIALAQLVRKGEERRLRKQQLKKEEAL